MDAHTTRLFDEALAARERSYSPYSKYRVGAAIRTSDGGVFVGCNVENAAFPEGTCAEAGAISAMVVGSSTRPTIATIVTLTEGPTPGTPCGGCRQKIREFADDSTRIHAMTVDGDEIDMAMDEILPSSFGPDRLL